MDLADLGSIGELVGGVAVIATLFYLAVQVRQNTTGSRNAAYDGTVATWTDVLRPLTENIELFRRGAAGTEKLDPSEALLFKYIMAQMFSYLESGFAKTRGGSLPDDEEWERVSRLLVWYLQCPGIGTVWWPETRMVFTQSFVDHVERVLDELNRGTIERFDHSEWLEAER